MCSSTVIYLYSAENYICIHNHMMNVRIHVLHLFSFTLVATKLMRSLLCNRAIFRRTKESSSWPRPDIWYFKCEIHMHMIFVCMNHWQTWNLPFINLIYTYIILGSEEGASLYHAPKRFFFMWLNIWSIELIDWWPIAKNRRWAYKLSWSLKSKNINIFRFF